MNDHFSSMLAPSQAKSKLAPFIKAAAFQGKKEGYKFQKGPNGIGYYIDAKQNKEEAKKRPLEEDDDEAEAPVVKASKPNPVSIEQLLEEADTADITVLNPNSLQQLVLSFEKKISKNQKMRMKHSEDPSKFLESEVELHAEINNLYAVSASPELYPLLVSLHAIPAILGMELTEPDTVLEVEEASCIVDALLSGQALELLVQNLSRLDESNEEDAQGVHDTMSVLENLIEIRPMIAVTVCEKTHIVSYLLKRLSEKSFDPNKLYCSEILSILFQVSLRTAIHMHSHTQTDSANINALSRVKDGDGMEMLLKTIFHYRKRDPESSDEEECIQNLFLSLCAALLLPQYQKKFLEVEGIELMIKCLQENKFAACKYNVLISSVNSVFSDVNRENCIRFVNAGGMKFAFPVLMGKPLGHAKKQPSTAAELEESVISVLAMLCLQVHDATEQSIGARLLLKFTENKFEKLLRTADLFSKYSHILRQTERDLDALVLSLEERVANGGEDGAEAEEELEVFNSPEERYLKCLQLLSVIMAYAVVHDNGCVDSLISRLQSHGYSISDMQNVLREMVANMDEDAKAVKQREMLVQWNAVVSSKTLK